MKFFSFVKQLFFLSSLLFSHHISPLLRGFGRYGHLNQNNGTVIGVRHTRSNYLYHTQKRGMHQFIINMASAVPKLITFAKSAVTGACALGGLVYDNSQRSTYANVEGIQLHKKTFQHAYRELSQLLPYQQIPAWIQEQYHTPEIQAALKFVKAQGSNPALIEGAQKIANYAPEIAPIVQETSKKISEIVKSAEPLSQTAIEVSKSVIADTTTNTIKNTVANGIEGLKGAINGDQVKPALFKRTFVVEIPTAVDSVAGGITSTVLKQSFSKTSIVLAALQSLLQNSKSADTFAQAFGKNISKGVASNIICHGMKTCSGIAIKKFATLGGIKIIVTFVPTVVTAPSWFPFVAGLAGTVAVSYASSRIVNKVCEVLSRNARNTHFPPDIPTIPGEFNPPVIPEAPDINFPDGEFPLLPPLPDAPEKTPSIIKNHNKLVAAVLVATSAYAGYEIYNYVTTHDTIQVSVPDVQPETVTGDPQLQPDGESPESPRDSDKDKKDKDQKNLAQEPADKSWYDIKPDETIEDACSRMWKVGFSKEARRVFDTGIDNAIWHYNKHLESLYPILTAPYGFSQYIADSSHIIKNGIFVAEDNAYIQLLGGMGKHVKVGVVGLERSTGRITTFHVKPIEEVIKKIPRLTAEFFRGSL